MLTLSILGILLQFGTACGTTKSPVPEAAEPATPTEQQAPAPDNKPADSTGADVKACYEQCLKDNQARAVDWAIVQRDCRAACDGTAPTLEQPLGE